MPDEDPPGTPVHHVSSSDSGQGSDAAQPSVQQVSSSDSGHGEDIGTARNVAAVRALAAIRHLDQKWGTDRKCPYCETNDWNVLEMAEIALWPTSLPRDPRGQKLLPVMPILCNNCGVIVTVSAVIAGVLSDEPSDRRGAEEES